MDENSHEDSSGEFWCVGFIFLTKLLGLMNKAIKLLLTELVGQCRNILPLAFSALTSLRSVNTEKAAGNIFLHWPPTQLIRVQYRLLAGDNCWRGRELNSFANIVYSKSLVKLEKLYNSTVLNRSSSHSEFNCSRSLIIFRRVGVTNWMGENRRI